MAAPQPCATVAVLPRWGGYRYMNLVSDPRVHVIARFERDTFSFLPPYFAGLQQSGAGRAKWPVVVLLIANERGLQEFTEQGLEGIRPQAVPGALIASDVLSDGTTTDDSARAQSS